ncbi:MAG: hypothetical protein E6559_09140, partial [Pantoea sp.]|nr:hypothetical protein [Pantoea sp.]
ALSWGVRGRRFKSSRADQNSQLKQPVKAAFFMPAVCLFSLFAQTQRLCLVRLPRPGRGNMVYTDFCVGNEEESLCITLKKTIQTTRPSQATNVLNRIKSSNPQRPPRAAFLLALPAQDL